MKTIKFSHIYDKFYHTCEDIPIPPKKAKLLEVFLVKTEDLHPDFIRYDTLYQVGDEFKQYKLPKGKVIVLLFKTYCFMFTTIRRYTPRKYQYYLDSRGEEFKIVIKEDDIN